MRSVKKGPRPMTPASVEPEALSHLHSLAKEMSPSLNAGHGKNQPANIPPLSGVTASAGGPVGLDLIWGAENIARVINLNTRQTFHHLSTGSIPAKKVGGKWVAELGNLRDFFLEGGAQ